MTAAAPGASLDGLVVPFGLVLARTGTFVGTCPVFVPDSVSPTVRGAVAGILALCLAASVGPLPEPHALVPAFLGELLIGGLLALSVRLIALAIGFAGELFDINFGYSFARTMNPMLAEEATPIMQLAQMLSMVLFFLAGGQGYVLRGLALSLVAVPPGSGRFEPAWAHLLAHHLADMVQAGLLLALPITLTMMCTQLALALLSRLAPSLNVWAIGLLGTCGMGLLALWSFMPAFVQALLGMWRSFVPFGELLHELSEVL